MNSKTKNCGKVKNSCKYCLEQVTNKNGLQCQGACKKWAHYKCLNYTPGKISDIKAGIIKVMCPCPDCETTQIKEYLSNPPYSCSNQACPANSKGPIKCDSAECPTNKIKKPKLPDPMKSSNKACPDDAAALEPKKTPRSYLPGPRSCLSPVNKCKNQLKKKIAKKTSSDASDPCKDIDCKNSSTSSCDPKTQASMAQALQEMCCTVGKLSTQIKDLMTKINKLA